MNPEPPTSGSVAHPDDDATRNLCLWPFGDPHAAARLERELCTTGTDPVVLADGALLTWRPGRRVPHLREPQNIGRSRPLGLGFWGLLFGIVVAGPDLETLVGEPRTGLDGVLAGVGIDRQVLVDLRRGLRPGRSAVAAICDEAVAADIERVTGPAAAAAPLHDGGLAHSMRRRFTAGQEEALRRVFSA